MILWLFRTLIGWPWCAHVWVTTEERDCRDRNNQLRGSVYYQCCTKCGDIRRKELAA